MGSCVSLNKVSESAVKLRSRSKKEKLVIPSPIKETVNGGDRTEPDVAPKTQSSSVRFAGSRDESFFDSQPWLESDCEDDFYSVNGDFTPSRGNTPLHHSFAAARVNKTSAMEQKDNSPPEDDSSSPTDQKKRLSELFKDSLRVDDKNAAEGNDNNFNASPTKSGDKPSNLAESTNGTRTDLNGGIVAGGNDDDHYKDKSSQCCVPGLLTNRSLSGRKKKVTSPVDHRVG